MTNQYLAGIDIGTSGCKVALFTPDGEILFQGTTPYQTHYPQPGYAEQNPEDWWRAVCNGLRHMLHRTGVDPKQIKGVGVDGMSGAAVPMDGQGRALRNAMIWLDRRTVRQCESITERIGAEQLFAVSGNPMSPSYVTGKMLWIKENEPDLYTRTAKVLQCNSYIVYRLTGEYSQDVSQGNGFHAFDIETAAWDEALSERIGVAPELLPPVYRCSDIVGGITMAVATETGLTAGTTVVAGGLDAACATLGAGAIHVGEVQEQGGQAGGMSIVMDRPVKNEKLILSCHVVPDRWILQGGTVGGGSLNWLKREFAGEAGDDFFALANEAASRVKPGSEGLLFLPYMAGERSPIWDPNAKGVFLGLSFEKTKGHMIRAIMEGCAMALRHNLATAEDSGVPVHTLHSVGGAANSALWTQIKADVTGKAFKIPSSDSAAALGAAILAGIGTGIYRDAEDAVARTVRIQREQAPLPGHTRIYNQAFDIYLEAYNRLKDLFPRMGW
ncbi:carbohydrate kinase [Paenibacillus darwinianus]|uniref:Xylulose kinase n=1 Tax=Paenibacillus darwinianus TaxID=1380763 RepID=A0A9W5S3I5_9BACL|nr:xylulokinase [Paenibacillus darwinianus]EXX91640.1 carbohydrate kinase [Paenibacillus darwinianus]EXX91783.1 carbohydrate kinase [Paenibacillus darwinianus]EXX92395.1 carbohydrate kinase [Paenibacillus darwinianus]